MKLTQAEIERKYPHKPLKEQKALVTGASSGIGEAVARHMAAAGASIMLNYVSNKHHADLIVKEIIDAGAAAVAVHADVSSEPAVKRMFQKMHDQYGAIDILVNNAGIQKDAPSDMMSLKEWEAVLKVDLTGQFLCAREAILAFKNQGIRPKISSSSGKIIHISSVHQEIPWSEHANYTAAKGGVEQLMRTLAQEEAPSKIRVNAIAPGAIQTAINKEVWESPEALNALLKMIPSKRMGSVDEVAQAAVWLASDDADYIVGTTLYVDGGISLHNHFSRGG